jgi:glucose/arabinose dehydrogenase
MMAGRQFIHTAPRHLHFEALEPRQLLAGDTYLVNFQLAGAPVPTRYLADTGLVFGDRGGGQFYGWSTDHTGEARDRNLVLDQRLDTLIHFHAGQKWEFQLAGGTYQVTVAVGDPANNDGLHTINVEGVNFLNAVADTNSARIETRTVTVSDGRLSIDQGAAAEKATRINYIQIVGVPSGPNAAPAAPTITEPATDGQVISPSDVHMEAIGYSDPDGNAHKSTDWEIWTTGGTPTLAWQTQGITGVERLHTHMGDGIFVGSHAGRSSFFPNTDYELRVRFRDDVGSVSSYAVRTFHTAAAAAIFPLEINDVSSLAANYWLTTTNVAVDLPSASPVQPELRLEGPTGSLLLRVAGLSGAGNSVTNPAALSGHTEVRVVLVAGSNPLVLAPTNFAFIDEHGETHKIFLPAINLAAGARGDLWVATNGATYYGNAAQTEPDFSTLARASDTAFTALQPGFVVEEVAGDFQLPTNIAFVPNPGPNPNDPLFYVGELYGTIKVVTRDFSVSTYATGLLNFNPTGNFPGSGEQGVAGIVVDPTTGDLFATRVTSSTPGVEAAPHYPQVIRLISTDGGHTASSITVIRDMVGETMGQSHQISNATIGPDGKLYVHVGDGFDFTTAQNLDSYRGKVLRMNFDGSAPSDNPFYNDANGINARDYVFAYGLRNPFGGTWRAADGKHYEVENGPSIDRMAQINRGVNYGWNNTDASMTINAIYNWNPAHAPVNLEFIQSATFAGSQFPASKLDHVFVSESGPTYATGPQTRGKRVVEFTLDANGNRVSGPTTLVEYTGSGQGTVVGLAAGPDGLYFTELYKDLNASSPIEAGARVFRIRYVNSVPGDYDINGTVNSSDHTTWRSTFGSNVLLGADGNRNSVVDAADYVLWRKRLPAGAAAGNGTGGEASLNSRADSATENTVASSVGDKVSTPRAFAFSAMTSTSNNFVSQSRAPTKVLQTFTDRRFTNTERDAALLEVLAKVDSAQAFFKGTKLHDDDTHRGTHFEQTESATKGVTDFQPLCERLSSGIE